MPYVFQKPKANISSTQSTPAAISPTPPIQETQSVPALTTSPGDDLRKYNSIVPVVPSTGLMTVPKDEGKVGILHSLVYGTPDDPSAGYYGQKYDPNYEPTPEETLASTISPLRPIRAAGEALGNIFNPSQLEARGVFDKMRADNPNADVTALETQTLGEKKTTGQNLIKFAGGAAEAALNIFTLGAAGKALKGAEVATQSTLTAGEIAARAVENPAVAAELKALQTSLLAPEAATLTTKMTNVATKLGHSALEGGKYGTLYGSLYGMQEYDSDWLKTAGAAVEGGLMGAVTMPFFSALGMLGGAALKAVAPAANATAGVAVKVAPEAVLTPRAIFKKISDQLSEAGESDLAEYWKGFAAKKDYLDAEARTAAGKLVREMTELGQISPSSIITKKGLKVEGKFNAPGGGGDEEAMFEGTLAHLGIGKYADPAVQKEFINSNPIFQNTDRQRVSYFATSQAKEVWNGKVMVDGKMVATDPSKYVPSHTPQIKIPSSAEKLLAKTSDPAERVAIYTKVNPQLERTARLSVIEGHFPDAASSLDAYHHYQSFINSDGKVLNKDNKFLQWLVQRDGGKTLKTVDDAAAVLLKTESSRKAALTGRSSSLDYVKDLQLPWRDTNIARTMSNYSLDATTRLKYAEAFGADDKVLWEAINKVGQSTKLGAKKPLELKKDLEDMVRIVMETKHYNSKFEKASAWLRMMETPKVTWSAIRNLGQTLNNPLAADMPSALKGLAHAFSDEGISKAMDSGVLLDSYMKHAFEFANGNSKISSSIYKYSGFSTSEIINRTIGANVADHYYTSQLNILAKKYGIQLGDSSVGKALAKTQQKFDAEVASEFASLRKSQPEADGKELYQMAKDKVAINYPDLVENTTNIASKKASLQPILDQIEREKPDAYWALKDAGIDIGDVLSKGYLSDQDKAAAAYRFVEKTQFSGNHMDLPAFAGSPFGKVLMQFKTFGYRQAQFSLGTLKKQMERGQFAKALKTITYLGTIMPMGNAALSNVRSMITQEKVPTTAFDQWYHNLFDAASFGLMSDFVQRANKNQTIDWAVGPVASDFANYSEALFGLGSGIATGNKKGIKTEFGNLAKQVVRNVGLTPIYNTINPNKNIPGAPARDILFGKTKTNFFSGKKKSR